MIDYLKQLNPDFGHIQDSTIENGTSVFGYQSTIFGKSGAAISGGCAPSKEVSKRIAVAEFIERALVQQIAKSPKKNEFKLVEFASTGGFAAGFESLKTQQRAELEAVERWAWSKWIDEGFRIPEIVNGNSNFDPLSNFFLDSFEKTKLFEQQTMLSGRKIKIQIFLGYHDNGVFPGSRASYFEERSGWNHAILEAWRHKIIFLNQIKKSIVPNGIIDQRIHFFGSNAVAANSQIEIAQKQPWPSPRLALSKSFDTKQKGIFLHRALCEDFVSWHLGPKERFVY